MIDPLFWLGLSLLLVSFSLFAVLLVTIPTLQEVGRAARSAEKLFDTLNREFPPTLEAIRLTGKEVGELTDDLNQGIGKATGIVQRVDRGLVTAQQQVQQNSRGLVAGAKAAWKVWRSPTSRVVKDVLDAPQRTSFPVEESPAKESQSNK
ncbi:MAG: hypothetical protein HC930_15245 [Hydrococcus sp. SU_1_0]|nr:hypothetical protein [Hydrococcus sp. SU_1_0]